MKTVKLTVLFLFLPIVFFAQTLTGLWVGSVHNDSTTIRKDQAFEIVLTQYKDKVYGYSRSTFTVHDSLFYIVKRVKGTIDGDVCEVKDDDIVSYNFPGRLDKGVKMVSTFHFDHGDSTWRMDGDWKTNKTKKYYSLSGKIALSQEKDLEKSKIFPHLEELKLADDVAFYNDYKKATAPVVSTPLAKNNNKGDIAKTNKSPETSPKETRTTIVQNTPPEKHVAIKDEVKPVATSTDEKTNNTIDQKRSVATAETKQSTKEEKPVPLTVKETKTEPLAQTKQSESKENNTPAAIVQNKRTVVAQTNQPVNDPQKMIVKEEPKKLEPLVTTKPDEPNKNPATDKPQPVSIFSESRPAVTSTAAIHVAERKITPPQVVNFVSDSLELALYDNGEVDGDTVSVLLNGEIILARQGLKASAIRKTIYVPAGKDDSLTLVLYAENLGKYPPNTGLLIVHDGDETYQVRFSADLTQNAAVIFKRKRK